MLLDDGDFVLQQGDFALVADADNFRQAMTIMIETGFGTDIFNVNYGFDAQAVFTTAQTTQATKDLIRLQIVKSLSQDNRVKLINDVVFDDDPAYYQYLPTANANADEQTRRTTRQWQALIVLQTISQGQVSLQLEGTGLYS